MAIGLAKPDIPVGSKIASTNLIEWPFSEISCITYESNLESKLTTDPLQSDLGASIAC